MPKQKTHTSSKKRFKVTGTGKVLHKQAFRSHILSKRPTKRMRHLREAGQLSGSDSKRLKRIIDTLK